MSKLAKYDQNMASETGTVRDESLFYPDPFAPPFRLGGFYWYSEDRKLHRLPEREKRIVAMRFGLGGRKERTQKEVADIMGISQSYISRLEKRIMQRLRREIGREICC